MENQDKQIVEINGVKMELDLRTARVVENYRVGDRVKVLVKEYSDYKSYAGVIIGFDNFKNLPTIIIAYIAPSYTDVAVRFVYLNAQTKDCEIVPMTGNEIPFDRVRVLAQFDSMILKKEEELRDLQSKKQYFLSEFGAYFKDFATLAQVDNEPTL